MIRPTRMPVPTLPVELVTDILKSSIFVFGVQPRDLIQHDYARDLAQFILLTACPVNSTWRAAACDDGLWKMDALAAPLGTRRIRRSCETEGWGAGHAEKWYSHQILSRRAFKSAAA